MSGHKEISRHLDKEVELMDFQEWNKFCLHTNLVPHIISPEDSKTIFKILIRESVEKAKTEDPNMN